MNIFRCNISCLICVFNQYPLPRLSRAEPGCAGLCRACLGSIFSQDFLSRLSRVKPGLTRHFFEIVLQN
jgi:hypothetical protein